MIKHQRTKGNKILDDANDVLNARAQFHVSQIFVNTIEQRSAFISLFLAIPLIYRLPFSTTLADFYGSFVAIVYGNAGMLAAEAD